jgi:IQ and AAA domain-containing protein
MSNKTYADLICETSELIVEATQADEAVFEAGPADRLALQTQLSDLRIRYTVLLSKLDTVYDQMLQPQKRLIVRRLLEACLGRLIEIKHDLVEIHISDYTYDDDEVRDYSLLV